jgi:hypothetical protein
VFMLKIVWNRKELEDKIRLGEGERYTLDFWIPVQVFINGIDISGLEKNPRGDISQFYDLFVNFYYVFTTIDPERLANKEFGFASNDEKRVSGGGFSFYVEHQKKTDLLSISYHNFNFEISNIRKIISIPLKDFTKGLLISTKELLDELLSIDPKYKDDEEYRILEEDMGIIRSWYLERYGEYPSVKKHNQS